MIRTPMVSIRSLISFWLRSTVPSCFEKKRREGRDKEYQRDRDAHCRNRSGKKDRETSFGKKEGLTKIDFEYRPENKGK